LPHSEPLRLKRKQTFFSSKKPPLAFDTLFTLGVLLIRFCKMIGSNCFHEVSNIFQWLSWEVGCVEG